MVLLIKSRVKNSVMIDGSAPGVYSHSIPLQMHLRSVIAFQPTSYRVAIMAIMAPMGPLTLSHLVCTSLRTSRLMIENALYVSVRSIPFEFKRSNHDLICSSRHLMVHNTQRHGNIGFGALSRRLVITSTMRQPTKVDSVDGTKPCVTTPYVPCG